MTPAVTHLLGTLHFYPSALGDLVEHHHQQSRALTALAMAVGGEVPGLLLHQGPAAAIDATAQALEALRQENASLRSMLDARRATPCTAAALDLVETIVCSKTVLQQDREAHQHEGAAP